MSVLVTDAGFAPATAVDAVPLTEIAAHRGALDLVNTDDPAAVVPHFAALRLIRIAHPVFSDGRGFTLGRLLRTLGYGGELRVLGPLLADQYAMARRVGFDAVEIPDEHAARQPEAQWRFRADWRAHHYQARLRA